MADSSDEVNSWPGLIGQVNKTFNLVRDIFGYGLPGGVFLAIGVISKRIDMIAVWALFYPYHVPAWMAFIAIVAACYVVGNVMAATAYLPFMILKYLVWMKYRHPPEIVASSFSTPQARAEGTWWAWLFHHPTEISKEMVEIRDHQPKLMDILDRRETQALLAASMTAALGGGWYVFCHANWSFGTILWVAGLISLIQFLTGMPHVRRVFQSTKDYYYDPTPNKPKEEPDLAPLLAALIKAATAALHKIGS